MFYVTIAIGNTIGLLCRRFSSDLTLNSLYFVAGGISLELLTMAKSKNHTNHNQSKRLVASFLPYEPAACATRVAIPPPTFFVLLIVGFQFFVDRKDHRNGIKRPKKFRHESKRGVSSHLHSPYSFYSSIHIRISVLRCVRNSCATKGSP